MDAWMDESPGSKDQIDVESHRVVVGRVALSQQEELLEVAVKRCSELAQALRRAKTQAEDVNPLKERVKQLEHGNETLQKTIEALRNEYEAKLEAMAERIRLQEQEIKDKDEALRNAKTTHANSLSQAQATIARLRLQIAQDSYVDKRASR